VGVFSCGQLSPPPSLEEIQMKRWGGCAFQPLVPSLFFELFTALPIQVNQMKQTNTRLYYPRPITGTMATFERTDDIFDQKEAFSESFQPGAIEGRDEEIRKYVNALQPVINGHQPNNIFLYGNTGVGKTAVTEFVLDQLQSDASRYDDLDLTVIYINCKTLTSSYQVAVSLTNEIRPEDNQISHTGLPQSEVYQTLYSELNAIGDTILIVFDEVDSIGEKDEILYELPRAKKNGNLNDTTVGIIGISNDFSFREKMDPRVQSTLCQREIQFPPYNANELREILASRASIGIKKGVLQTPLDEDAAISFCAAVAAQDRGDARQALDILQRAGEIASTEGDSTITEEHTKTAHSRYERDRVKQGMRDLTQHGQLSLVAVVSKTAKQETPCTSKDIYEEYSRICRKTGYDKLVTRSIQNHLSDLQMVGILSGRDRRQGSPGNDYEYELNVSFSSALEAMKETTALDDILQIIEDAARTNGIS
jgi:cell division control protein 6